MFTLSFRDRGPDPVLVPESSSVRSLARDGRGGGGFVSNALRVWDSVYCVSTNLLSS